LNDSKEPIETHRDIHTTLGNGEIWAREDAYMTFVNWACEHSAPIILERNDNPEKEAIADLKLITRKKNA
jgi:endonuclease IV